MTAFLLRTLAESLLDWKQCLSRLLLQPSVYLLAFGGILGRALLGRIDGGAIDYAVIVAPGIICIIVMNGALGCVAGIFLRGYYSHSMEAWLQMPISPRGMLVAIVGGGAVIGTFSGCIGVILVWLILGLSPSSLGMAILILCMGSLFLSLLFAAIFALTPTPDKSQEFLGVLMMPMTFLGCTFFDYQALVHPWNKVALLMPTTYLSEALRMVYRDAAAVWMPASLMTGGAVVMACLLLLADWLFRRRFRDFQW